MAEDDNGSILDYWHKIQDDTDSNDTYPEPKNSDQVVMDDWSTYKRCLHKEMETNCPYNRILDDEEDEIVMKKRMAIVTMKLEHQTCRERMHQVSFV